MDALLKQVQDYCQLVKQGDHSAMAKLDQLIELKVRLDDLLEKEVKQLLPPAKSKSALDILEDDDDFYVDHSEFPTPSKYIIAKDLFDSLDDPVALDLENEDEN